MVVDDGFDAFLPNIVNCEFFPVFKILIMRSEKNRLPLGTKSVTE